MFDSHGCRCDDLKLLRPRESSELSITTLSCFPFRRQTADDSCFLIDICLSSTVSRRRQCCGSFCRNIRHSYTLVTSLCYRVAQPRSSDHDSETHLLPTSSHIPPTRGRHSTVPSSFNPLLAKSIIIMLISWCSLQVLASHAAQKYSQSPRQMNARQSTLPESITF